MLFNSLPFVVFLPIVYVLYRMLGRRAQNLFLLAASYVFYGWWDWRFLSLIVFSSFVDYVAALFIQASEKARVRRAGLGASLVTQLGLLGLFKDWDFGVTAMCDPLRGLGVAAQPKTLGLILPSPRDGERIESGALARLRDDWALPDQGARMARTSASTGAVFGERRSAIAC